MATTTGTGSYTHTYTNPFTAPQSSPRTTVANLPAQPRPSSQSSTQSGSSFATTPRPGQYATPKSIPQKRSFSDFQPASQSFRRSASSATLAKDAEQSSTLTEVMAKARAVVAASKSQSPQVPFSSIPTSSPAKGSATKSGERSVLRNDPKLIAQMAAKQREENARAKAAQSTPPQLPHIPEEPLLKPGEAPSLATHPHLIAQMMARKRAENEMLGHRERWTRKQQEYRMSLSPGAQLTNELNAQVCRNGVKLDQPRTTSNPLPAQSVPTIPPLKPPTPIVFNVQAPTSQTPAAETASTPATEDSARLARANSERGASNGNDSLFGSPFSSPIVEFLEKATDNAGLREALEPNEIIPTRTSVSVATAPISKPSGTTRIAVSASTEAARQSQAQSEIPPLFSDKPINNQPQPHMSSTTSVQKPSTFTHQQPQADPYKPIQGQASQAPPQQTGGRPQLAPRQPPAPRAIPYYPQNAGMPGYYRVEINQNWPGSGSSFVATPASAAPPPNAYGQAPPQANMAFGGYNMGPVNPYVPGPGLPPPPGPLQTYGSTVATAAATERVKQQASSAGYLTAADLVAGINTKFKNATKSGFSVPKR